MRPESSSHSIKDELRPVINIDISDVILTPVTVSKLVNEIFKHLLYQKNQIPYPYSWLKNIVNRKRGESERNEKSGPTNFKAANHFRVVSKGFDILESLMKGITNEFSESLEIISEIVIIFGTTPQCPKEVFKIKVMPTVKGHSERNHLSELNKYQQRILRKIFLSQKWMDSMDTALTCTNTYVFLKKYSCEGDERTTNDQDCFKVIRPLNLSSNTRFIEIKFNANDVIYRNCCDDLVVFSENIDNNASSNMNRNSDKIENVIWYQSKEFFQGFKDCVINSTSASELW